MEDFDEMLEHLKIDDWTWVLIADGSGTTADKACGWGTVLVGRNRTPIMLSGGLSRGTNITAEIMGVNAGLQFLYNEVLDHKAIGQKTHVITDCRHVTSPETWSKHRDLATWLKFYSRDGMILKLHWIDRNKFKFNLRCHNMANIARRAIAEASDVAAIASMD